MECGTAQVRLTKALVVALFALTPLFGWPRTPTTHAAGGASDGRITLDVVVTGRSGNPVAGLTQQDFTILDDKRQNPIVAFNAVAEGTLGPPLRVVFVMDEVNVPFRSMASARQQLEKYLRRDGGQLPVPMSLVIFSEKSTQVQGTPTRDGNLLADSVRAIGAGAPRELEGGQFENRVWRLQISLRAFGKLAAYEATQPGRKLLIWLGPGWPLITDSADRLTTKEQQEDFRILVNLSTILRDGHVTAYSIDPLGTDDAGTLGNVYYENFLDGVPSPSKFRSGSLTLGVLSVQSGGLVLNRSNDVASLIGTCVADAKSYYSLTFESRPAAHPDEYHDLRVTIGKPGMVGRTRTGYYAQP